MTDTPDTWRQEVEQILAEIAEDPKARLLRVPSVDRALSLARQEPVGTLAPGLTKAERYLLATHREELAFLLRERCFIAFHADPRASSKWHRYLDFESVEVPDESDWRHRAREATDCDLADPTCESCIATLRSASVDAGVAVRVDALAAASLRIATSDAARTYLALQLVESNRHEEARSICHDLRTSTKCSLVESVCWENIAWSFQVEGLRRDAATAYRSSSDASTERIMPRLFWFTSAVLAGERHEALLAGRAVEDSTPQNHDAVGWAENAARVFARSRSSKGEWAEIDPPGGATARILDALGC
jgi:hypothetical protein